VGGVWPLTGRDDELRGIIGTLTGDEHHGVLIAGKAGVGKSRLAREVGSAMSAKGWAIRQIAGTSAGRSVTMGPFVKWIDGEGASTATPLAQVLNALTEDVRDAPLLLIADDIQWVDDMSALVLHQLVVQGLANVVMTMRSGESAPDTVMALWKDEHLSRVDLQPLERKESDRLVQNALGGRPPFALLDRLWQLTLGNALFLRHLVDQEIASNRLAGRAGDWKWVAGPVASPSLVDLVKLQIGVVPDDLREVVDLVAVAEPIEWSCLATLVDPELVEAAAQRGLVEISHDGTTVRAGHPLYTEVRWEECGPRRLRHLRTAVVKAMLAQGTETAVDPLRLGMLWLESDLAADAEVFSAAAQCASGRLDFAGAERFARAAFDADPSEQGRMLLAYIEYMNGNGPEVEKILASADIGYPAKGFINPVTLRAANRLWALQEPLQAREIIEEALLHSSGDASNILHTFHSFQLAMAARPEAALAEVAATDQSQLDPFGQVLGRCAQTMAAGDAGRVQEACESAAAGYAVIAEAPQDSIHELGLSELHVHGLLLAGHLDSAQAVAESHYSRSAGIPGMTRTMAQAVVGATHLARGDLSAALEHLAAAHAAVLAGGDINETFYRFAIIHVEALARGGRIAAAMDALNTTRANRHAAYEYVTPSLELATAWVTANRGSLDEARKICCQAAELARANGQWAREVLCLQTAVQFGFTEGADRLSALAAVVEGPRAPAAARYATALAAADGAALEASSAEYELMGDVLVAADAAAQAAAIHRVAGRRGSALSANSRALQLARQGGGAVSPALHAAHLALPLTQREHEIVLLVAKGLTNREIAAAMSLSVRTVEGHVFRATVKAGVSGRSELSALASSE
jgi:DNA-binding NarL/FixJ family response regulator